MAGDVDRAALRLGRGGLGRAGRLAEIQIVHQFLEERMIVPELARHDGAANAQPNTTCSATAPCPPSAYYGVHTLRALENFPITGTPISIYPDLVIALACVKQAAALANHELGLLDDAQARRDRRGLRGDPRGRAARGVRGRRDPGRRRHLDQHERQRGDRQPRARAAGPARRASTSTCIPIEHVNLCQSTNDVYPTAVKVALHFGIHRLVDAMAVLRSAFAAKAHEFADVLKMGRTQLQDAVPMTLGPGVLDLRRDAGRGRAAAARGGDADPRDQPGRDRDRHRHQRPSRLRGAGVPRAFATITGIPLVTAPNLVEATQDCGAFVQLSGVLKRVAVKLSKICNDLRLLSSGPRAGLGEINLPPMQAGSSHHAGQGEPGDSRGREPDRVRGDRQRRHGHAWRRRRGSCS